MYQALINFLGITVPTGLEFPFQLISAFFTLYLLHLTSIFLSSIFKVR